MLDTFEIVTTSGVVLWSRSTVPISSSLINNFITDVFIEERSGAIRDGSSASSNPPYRSDQHTLKWTFHKELGIIFVAVYRSLLHLSWIDKLVDNIKTIFVKLYGEQLTKPNTTIVECQSFDEYYNQQIKELEGSVATNITANHADDGTDAGTEPPLPPGLTFRGKQTGTADEKSVDSSPNATPDVSRPNTPSAKSVGVLLPTPLSGPGGKMSRRARKAQNVATSAPASSGDEEALSRKRKVKAPTLKQGRQWDADGLVDERGDVKLDYTAGESGADVAVGRSSAIESVDASTWGNTTKGKFVLKDLEDEVHSMLESEKAKTAAAAKTEAASGGLLGTGLSTIGGLFRNVIGGKTLTDEDLKAALAGMEKHLLEKNVAREAAVRLCDGVKQELVGTKTANFETTNARIRTAMEASLTKMLTPTSSLDLLREIDAVVSPPLTSLRKPRPYVISIVGVNGVGKSTNLSKICFFLLQNKYRVLIAAGDTFRSGAVEQLRTHVTNLSELAARQSDDAKVELYEKGYGKDAAAIARDAVIHASSPLAPGSSRPLFDVVLIDTAGRRHNDQRLMSSLEKFAKLAQPDKILMVGEALVGSDSVAQARNFDSAFGATRRLDGFVISKCDTVGDMVGALVSLVHATGVPILFVGVGQHYSDLRNFSVSWAVGKLLTGGN